MRSNIGPRMDRLPISKWHYKVSLVANSAPPIAILVAYLIMPIFGWLAMFAIGGVAALIV